jgi:hypothetical protein
VKEGVVIYRAFNASREVQAAVAGQEALAQPAATRLPRRRASDRVIRPLKPGNAGGGKDPDFWCAFEDGKVTVIGDEPANTDCDPDPSEKAVS